MPDVVSFAPRLTPTVWGSRIASEVRRATLHNLDYVTALALPRRALRVGDRVAVVRAGDVIPKVTAVLQPADDDDDDDAGGDDDGGFAPPVRCPVCDGPTVRDGPALRCAAGGGCSAQTVGALAHACSRGALDLRGLGRRKLEEVRRDGLHYLGTYITLHYITLHFFKQ